MHVTLHVQIKCVSTLCEINTKNTIIYGKVQVRLRFYLIFSTGRMSEFRFGSGSFTASFKSPWLHVGNSCVLLLRWTRWGEKCRNLCNSFILPLTNITIKYKNFFVINSHLTSFVQEQAFGYLAFLLSSGNFMTMRAETSKKCFTL